MIEGRHNYLMDSSRNTQLTDSNPDPAWGFHFNKDIYSLSCPPCPKWPKTWEQQNWHRLGVVVWDTRANRVIHLNGSQALHILKESRQSKTWKEERLLVGEVAHRFAILSNRKSKSKIANGLDAEPSQEDG